MLLLLGLSGNAGKWRAQPNGVRIGRAPAPAARLKPGANVIAPDEKPKAKPKRKTKTATPKSAPKKPRGRPRRPLRIRMLRYESA